MKLIKKVYHHVSWRLSQFLYISIPQKYLSLFIPKMVMSGPFKGMRYLNESFGSVILPKLVGTYEDELHEIFQGIKNEQYRRFVDIGAAEGYYAIGFKKYLLPKTDTTIAFEASAKGRKLIKKLADMNAVVVDVRGFCTIDTLSNALNDERTFLLVDIEGGEFELLNPNKINFEYCDLLVEVHYLKGVNKEAELIEKFNKTHEVFLINKGVKKLPTSVSWNSIIAKYSDYVVNEFRGPQTWLFMKSRKYGNNQV